MQRISFYLKNNIVQFRGVQNGPSKSETDRFDPVSESINLISDF